MAKANRKTKPARVQPMDGPTIERLTRATAAEVDAPRMADEAWTGPAGKSMLFLSPVKHWHQIGWVDDAGFVALHNYERLAESCSIGNMSQPDYVKPKVDCSPKSGFGPTGAALSIHGRMRIVDREARLRCAALAWAYVSAVLSPGGSEREDDIVTRMLWDVGRDKQRATRRAWVREVAVVLGEVMA